jgi:tRNA pseudouridine55 synthase
MRERRDGWEDLGPAGSAGAVLGGILVINKPRGMTSRAVVDRVAAWLPGMKVGHAGTLDPLASGVLIVCAGSSTRLVEVVQELPKSYRTRILLGARSDTLDADGWIEPQANPRIPSRGEVDAAVGPLVGEIVQVPPAYSAVKVRGRRAYDLARAGRPVELSGRRVRIDRIAVLHYEWPHLELEVDCGSGTYIRSIARDLGEALGCGGLVETLTRTRIGPFTIDQAVDPAELSAESLAGSVRSPLEALADWPRLVLDRAQVAAITAGQRLPAREFGPAGIPAGRVALVGPHGRVVALGESDPSQRWIQPRKVLGG